MNAKEAAEKTEEIRKDREVKRKAAESERYKEAVKKAKKDQETFAKVFSEGADSSIAEAVKEGKKKCLLYIGYSDESHGRAEDWFDNHGYVDIINKVVARLKRQGFKVERVIKESTYYINSSYEANYEVSW